MEREIEKSINRGGIAENYANSGEGERRGEVNEDRWEGEIERMQEISKGGQTFQCANITCLVTGYSRSLFFLN